MSVRVGVVVFPGSNCDTDTTWALARAGAEPVELWHEHADLGGVAAVVLPGGFAYGDYLRAGVIARFSPVMRAVAAYAADGGLVLGICNGFQVLAEAGLLPGALLRNRSLRFVCREVTIRAERVDTPFTHRVPEGRRSGCRSPTARAATTPTMRRSTRSSATAASSSATSTRGGPAGVDDRENPNGSLRAIAGVINAAGNVAGLMPHPERAADGLLGSDDGMLVLRSLVESAAARAEGDP